MSLPLCEKCKKSVRFQARVLIITNIRRKKMVVRGYHLSCARTLDWQGMLIGGLFANLPRKEKKCQNISSKTEKKSDS